MGDEKPASERAGDGKHDSATLLSRAERDAGNGSSVEPSSVGGARESKQGHGDEPDDGGGSDGKSDHSGQGRGAATGDETGEPSSVADGHRSSTGENGAVSEAGGSVTGSSTSAPVGQPISDLAVVRGMWEMQSVVQFCQVLRTTIGLSPAFREREAYERAVLEPELTESLNAPNELTCELVFRLCTVYKARDSSRCVEGWTQLLRSVLSTEERWREMWEANPLGVDGMGRFAQLSVQTRVEVLYALCLWKTDDVDEIRDALDSLVKFDDEAVRMGPRQLPFGVGRRPPVAPCVPPGDMFGDVPDSELEEEERVTWYFGDGLWTFQEQPPKATRDHVPFSNDPLMCSTCQSRSCKDKLVHCAACDRGYHSFCLKPPVEPGTSTWFCLPCLERLKNRKRHDAARSNSRYMNRKRTVEARLRVTAKRHAAVRASFDPEDPKLATALEGPIGRKPKITEPGCRVCGGLHKPAKGLLCDYCDGEYHMFCLSPPLRAVPQGDWACPSCKALLDSVEALKPVEIVAEPGCQVCGVDDDNGVLLCDACESECHMACLDPPLERVPEGDWFCPKCLVDVRQNPPTRGLDPGRRVDESDLEASDSDDEADDEGASDDEDSDVETTSRSSGGGAKRAGAGAGAGSSNGGQPITNGEEGKSGDAAASDGGSRSKGGTPAGGTAQTVAQMANRLGVSDRELRDDVPVGKTPAFVLNCRDAGRAGTWRCTSVEFQELEGLVATLNSSSSDDEGAAKTMLTSLLEKRREKWEREKSARRRALQWASVPRRRSDRSETLLAKQEEEARKRREFQERQRLQQEQRERERAERQRKIAEEKARVAAEEATARAAEQAREDALQKAIADVQRASRFLGNVLTAVMDLLCADEEAAFPFLEPVDVVGLGLSNYLDVIRQPMDYSTIRTRIAGGYHDWWDFAYDVKLVYNNCRTYNEEGSGVVEAANRQEALFKELQAHVLQAGIGAVKDDRHRMRRKKVPGRPVSATVLAASAAARAARPATAKKRKSTTASASKSKKRGAEPRRDPARLEGSDAARQGVPMAHAPGMVQVSGHVATPQFQVSVVPQGMVSQTMFGGFPGAGAPVWRAPQMMYGQQVVGGMQFFAPTAHTRHVVPSAHYAAAAGAGGAPSSAIATQAPAGAAIHMHGPGVGAALSMTNGAAPVPVSAAGFLQPPGSSMHGSQGR